MLRKTLLHKRQQIVDKDKKDAMIVKKLLEVTKNYTHIASYVPLKDEVNISLFNEIIDQNKKLYLPKMVGNALVFCKVSDFNNLIEGPFKVKEPTLETQVDLQSIECVIVPVVAYYNNYRMGYGKGYYDRTLAHFNGMTIGVAYGEQQCEDLIIEQHDICLTQMVTENEK